MSVGFLALAHIPLILSSLGSDRGDNVGFDSARYLGRATSRAKSDVANKLVSMLLHTVSKRITESHGCGVTDAKYTRSVRETFGSRCAYCDSELEEDRAAVEHLEGMNRYRVGLHVPGNVVVSCVTCNRQKRRDDQQSPQKSLKATGWESFLSHDATGGACREGCKTCQYWTSRWKNPEEKVRRLKESTQRIHAFQSIWSTSSLLSPKARATLSDKTQALYRSCQASALASINALIDEVLTEERSVTSDT